ncbi:uncharacterized protein BO96DRAFT_339235 [Aspergillus niger CBS 101883]|uniref:uncharacterized protein n=1 Tax=Aspergillus lacticoffeatus (strain CBS 101883) TaxID=1450533 RepID=UPI000D803571|nr:uncharacterized protein BO96DRAFT_339235 [Aspergillus niger CBS 101883]PYH55870.1 hypothetical protein BO96DRAFT_339235 [Aspergillus niger CBS 101883]
MLDSLASSKATKFRRHAGFVVGRSVLAAGDNPGIEPLRGIPDPVLKVQVGQTDNLGTRLGQLPLRTNGSRPSRCERETGDGLSTGRHGIWLPGEVEMGATRREMLGSCGGQPKGGVSLAQGLNNTKRALRKQTWWLACPAGRSNPTSGGYMTFAGHDRSAVSQSGVQQQMPRSPAVLG